MKQEDKENVIEFYKKVVWLPSMPTVDELTDKDLESLKDSMLYERWILSISYNKLVTSIKDTIKRLLNLN